LQGIEEYLRSEIIPGSHIGPKVMWHNAALGTYGSDLGPFAMASGASGSLTAWANATLISFEIKEQISAQSERDSHCAGLLHAQNSKRHGALFCPGRPAGPV